MNKEERFLKNFDKLADKAMKNDTTLPTLDQLVAIDTWNKRYREMQELLHHSPEGRKLIVEALNIIKENKDLSFGERKMLDQATNYEKYLKEQEAKVKKLFDHLDNVVILRSKGN